MGHSSQPRGSVALRPAGERGATSAAGLHGLHHFSFAAYQRADRLDWGGLRAVNHYRLVAGAARPATFHAGFEIVTLVTAGRLARTGTFAPLEPLLPGSVELVTSGVGAQLGARALGESGAEFLEFWVKARAPGGEPRRQWRPAFVASLDRPLVAETLLGGAAFAWDAEARLSLGTLAAREAIEREVAEGEHGYLVVLDGIVAGHGFRAETGDSIAVEGPAQLVLDAVATSRLLWVRTAAAGSRLTARAAAEADDVALQDQP